MTAGTMKLTRASRRELEIGRLCAALRNARQVLKTFRDNRKAMIKLSAGADWSDNASSLRRPYNGISLYQQVMLRALVNQTPRCLLTTWKQDQRRTARTAQNWANKQFERIKLGDELSGLANDALYWEGWMKVGVVTPVDSERVGFGVFAGEVFAERVSPDDMVYDTHARCLKEMGYVGHRYRAGVEVANKQFKLTGDAKLEGETEQSFNLAGDERAHVIARGWQGGDHDEYRDRADLWELYLPQHRAIVTLRSNNGGEPSGVDDLVEAREYVGPYCGPYTRLTFIDLPDQLPGKGPIADQIGLDVATNNVLRKIIRQANRFKQLDLYSGSAAEDAEKINQADDGEMISVARLNEIRPWMSTPPSPQLFALALQFKQLHNQICGNLDAIGGLQKQAGTASQENSINAAAMATVGAMQQKVVAATSKVMADMLWHWWHDQTGVMTDVYQLDADRENSVERRVGPKDRATLDWDDLEIKVDPYTLTADSPGSRLQGLDQTLQMAVPLTPIMQANGQSLDVGYYFKKRAEYTNNPDIEQLARVAEPAEPEAEDEGPGKSPVTERTYTRKSESEATQGGEEADMIQQMMGAGATGAGDFEGM